MTNLHVTAIAGLAALSVHSIRAENWPSWRGPSHDGSSTEAEVPGEFSKTKNVKWKIDLPGTGHSTPAVWGDAVFLSSVDEDAGGVVAMRINAENGDVVWSKKYGDGINQDNRSTYAGPSPSTDGKTVIFFTGNGDLVAFDFDGNETWKRNIQTDYGPFAFGWTFSTSPLFHQGKVYMQVLQRDVPAGGRGFKDKKNESYLLALNPANGEEIFRVIRDSEALMESREAFTSPVPIVHDGREEILVVGGDCLTGHDPQTGKELWRWGTWNPRKEKFWRLVPSPVYGDGIVLACAPKGQPVYAVKAGGNGDLGDAAISWVSNDKQISSDVPTPLFYEGYFYILNGRNKFLSCVEPVTGKVIWSERLDAKTKLESSPTGADGKIFVMSHLGEVFVVKAGKDFELLNKAEMGETDSRECRSSIVPANGNLFIRTDQKLFCIGE